MSASRPTSLVQTGEPQAISHRGRVFRNATEIVQYLQGLPRDQRYMAAREMVEPFLQISTWFGEQADVLWSYIEIDDSWKTMHTEQQFFDFWRPIREMAIENRKARNRVEEARRSISTQWGSEITNLLWYYKPSYHLASMIRKVALKYPWGAIVTGLNRQVLRRITQGGAGSNLIKQYSRNDFDAIFATTGRAPDPVSRDEARHYGFGMLPNGFMFDLASPPSIPGSAVFAMPGMANQPIRGEHTFPVGSSPTSPSQQQQLVLRTGAGSIGSPSARHRRHASSMSITAEQEGILQRIVASPSSPLRPHGEARSPTGTQDAIELQNLEEDLVQTLEENEEENPLEDEQCAQIVTRRRQRIAKGCGCHQNVPMALRRSLDDAKPISEVQAIKLLERVATCQKAKHLICYSHLKNMGSKLGLQTRLLNHAALNDRLSKVYQQRTKLGKLKTDLNTYNWFRKTHRPVRPADALGVYRFIPNVNIPDPQIDFEKIFDNFGGSQVIREFKEIGSVNISGVFSWWWNMKLTGPIAVTHNTIASVGLEEFDMYFHHLRRLGGRENYGWLRNMIHAQIQQVLCNVRGFETGSLLASDLVPILHQICSTRRQDVLSTYRY
jgi:hypothetical protein